MDTCNKVLFAAISSLVLTEAEEEFPLPLKLKENDCLEFFSEHGLERRLEADISSLKPTLNWLNSKGYIKLEKCKTIII